MKFKVIFKSKKNYYLLSIAEYQGGLDLLQLAREATDLAALTAERVSSKIPWLGMQEVAMELTEAQARDTGLFMNCNVAIVYADSEHVERLCVKLNPIIQRRDSTGEVLVVRWEKVISEAGLELLYTDWKAAGFPTDWEDMSSPTDFEAAPEQVCDQQQ